MPDRCTIQMGRHINTLFIPGLPRGISDIGANIRVVHMAFATQAIMAGKTNGK